MTMEQLYNTQCDSTKFVSTLSLQISQEDLYYERKIRIQTCKQAQCNLMLFETANKKI